MREREEGEKEKKVEFRFWFGRENIYTCIHIFRHFYIHTFIHTLDKGRKL